VRETLTREQEAALDALKATILDPATPTLVLTIDVPMRAAMLGVPWSRLRALLDQGAFSLSPNPATLSRPGPPEQGAVR